MKNFKPFGLRLPALRQWLLLLGFYVLFVVAVLFGLAIMTLSVKILSE